MYERYFGLIEPPFNVTPNPRRFFVNSCYQEAFSTLCSGIRRRAGIIVIVGEAGTGKTTLLKMFLGREPSNTHSSCILDPHLDFAEILLCTAESFGLSLLERDPLPVTHRLRGYLIEELRKDHFVALLVDEAQGLNDAVLEELGSLSGMEDQGKKLLQVVLIGQPGLESRLERSALRSIKQGVAACSRLAPLSCEDIQAYILFRLSAAGYRGRSIFMTRAVERICFYSKGIPRLINVICDNALLVAYAKSRKIVDQELIDEVASELQLGERQLAEAQATLTEAPSPEVFNEACQPGFVKPDTSREEWWLVNPEQNIDIDSDTIPVQKSAKTNRAVWPAALVTFIAVIAGGTFLFSRQERQMALSLIADDVQKTDQAFTPRPGRVVGAAELNAARPRDIGGSVHASKESGKATKSGANGSFLPATKDNDRASVPQIAQGASNETRSQERKKSLASRAQLKVSENSLVRDKPSSAAEIIATLRPGTEIRLVRRLGDYLLVQSVDEATVRGYVHVEDAFFKPSDNHAAPEY